jgi:hypothetical protein
VVFFGAAFLTDSAAGEEVFVLVRFFGEDFALERFVEAVFCFDADRVDEDFLAETLVFDAERVAFFLEALLFAMLFGVAFF